MVGLEYGTCAGCKSSAATWLVLERPGRVVVVAQTADRMGCCPGTGESGPGMGLVVGWRFCCSRGRRWCTC